MSFLLENVDTKFIGVPRYTLLVRHGSDAELFAVDNVVLASANNAVPTIRYTGAEYFTCHDPIGRLIWHAVPPRLYHTPAVGVACDLLVLSVTRTDHLAESIGNPNGDLCIDT